MRHTCSTYYHMSIARDPLAWRLKTDLIGYFVGRADTLEMATCHWCGRVLGRTVWAEPAA